MTGLDDGNFGCSGEEESEVDLGIIDVGLAPNIDFSSLLIKIDVFGLP